MTTKPFYVTIAGRQHHFETLELAQACAADVFDRTGLVLGIERLPFNIGQRVEIPVHYDLWMQGARFGEITAFRHGRDGKSDCYVIKMDHPQVKRRVRLWRLDWTYAKAVQ